MNSKNRISSRSGTSSKNWKYYRIGINGAEERDLSYRVKRRKVFRLWPKSIDMLGHFVQSFVPHCSVILPYEGRT
jgi:hypothetical protein